MSTDERPLESSDNRRDVSECDPGGTGWSRFERTTLWRLTRVLAWVSIAPWACSVPVRAFNEVPSDAAPGGGSAALDSGATDGSSGDSGASNGSSGDSGATDGSSSDSGATDGSPNGTGRDGGNADTADLDSGGSNDTDPDSGGPNNADLDSGNPDDHHPDGDNSDNGNPDSGRPDSGRSSSECSDASLDCAATCSGCFIDFECIPDGTDNPGNPCESCDPAANETAWSWNDRARCDDGQFCTVSDECVEGTCTGTTRQCDDGVACNGQEACDEDTDECAPGEVQCAGSACDLELDQCVASCAGCVVNQFCIAAGAENPNNPCLVCDPQATDEGYSIALGKPCGSGPETCSDQDTCDAGGVCRPNHSAAGSECGSASVSSCDDADSCDGEGTCQTNVATNGSTCDDGVYCSASSACQNGACVSASARVCPANQSCDEAAQACSCNGCQIGANCVNEGALDPNNPCRLCAPSVSLTAYSPNTGASCGNGATECSQQDTCSASGVCEPNHEADTTPCAGGQCTTGVCNLTGNPFDCVAPDPPSTPYPEVLTPAPPPPNMVGGSIPDGRYVPTRVDLYGPATAIDVRAFEFQAGFVQVSSQPYVYPAGTSSSPQIQFSGSYATSNDLLMFDLERCDPQYTVDVPDVWYTPSANGLTTVVLLPNGTPMVTIYARE